MFIYLHLYLLSHTHVYNDVVEAGRSHTRPRRAQSCTIGWCFLHIYTVFKDCVYGAFDLRHRAGTYRGHSPMEDEGNFLRLTRAAAQPVLGSTICGGEGSLSDRGTLGRELDNERIIAKHFLASNNPC